MKDKKLSCNFYLWEFVPPDIYDQYGNSSVWFIDPKIVRVTQFLRDFIGKPIMLNTYKMGSILNTIYTHSGFRPPYTSVGAQLSQHRFGRAADVKVVGMDAPEVRELIRENWARFKSVGLTTIEKATPTWTHIDIRQTNSDKLFEVNYVRK